MKNFLKFGVHALLILTTLAFSVVSRADSTIDQVRDRVLEQIPSIDITSVAESPLAGLYEVIADGNIYYVDESAEYLIDGSIIDLQNKVNLTDGRLSGVHMSLINEIGEENMLVYEPEQESSRSITVFTDISCGYCRKLHEELDTLLSEGVRVRYLMFPRAGLDSQGHKDLESVWCADDPQTAMTNAKAGGEIIPATCENPIELHVELAQRIGLRGTPLIYTDSGEKITGYREASVLAQTVNRSTPLQ